MWGSNTLIIQKGDLEILSAGFIHQDNQQVKQIKFMLHQWRKCSGIGEGNDILGECVPFNYAKVEGNVKGYLISEPNSNHDKLHYIYGYFACMFVCFAMSIPGIHGIQKTLSLPWDEDYSGR